MLFSRRFILSLVLTSASLSGLAAERIDYDIDDDGLIEIEDLQDLNEIRNNTTDSNGSKLIKGDRLYGSSDGCPASGCIGYELSTHLNLDSNGNDELDEADAFWNNGEGWAPIGSFTEKFVGQFNGNGYGISGLSMNRPGQAFSGLFAYAEQAYFHDLALQGDFIVGRESGALLGYSWQSRFENLQLHVSVSGEASDTCEVRCEPDYIGGVVGVADESQYSGIMLKGQVSGRDRVGGITGQEIANASSYLKDSAIQVEVSGNDIIGGLAGNITSSDIQQVAVVSKVTGRTALGGLFGTAESSTVNNALVLGSVTATGSGWVKAGGIAGSISDLDAENLISLVSLPADPNEDHFYGGLVGESSSSSFLTSYWARDNANTSDSHGQQSSGSYMMNYDVVDFKCAHASSDNCNGLVFSGFDAALNAKSQALWVFGNNTQLPAMVLASGRFTDQDENGELDEWPDFPAEQPPEESKKGKSNKNGLGAFYFVLLAVPLLMLRRRNQ